MAASMMRLQRDDASLDCPCADCLNQVPPRTIASLSPGSPTAADLYVMKLHEEAIHNNHSDQFSHASSSTPGLFGYNNGIIVGDPVWPVSDFQGSFSPSLQKGRQTSESCSLFCTYGRLVNRFCEQVGDPV